MSMLSDIIDAAISDTLTSELLTYDSGTQFTGTFHNLPQVDVDREQRGDGYILEQMAEGFILVSDETTIEKDKTIEREDGSVWRIVNAWIDGKALVWRFEAKFISAHRQGKQ